MNSKQTSSASRQRWLKEPRLLIVVVGVTLMVVLTALAFVPQPTVAAPPPPLTGTFNFIQVPEVSRLAQSPANGVMPPTVVLSDTFDFFSPQENPTVEFPGWRVFVQGGASQHKWGKVFMSDSVFTNTLWSTGHYTPFQTSAAAYVANMNTWAVYGPLNSSNYRDFEATFDIWPDFDVLANTKVGWAASIDGTNFCGQVELLSDAQAWLHRSFVLPKQCAGQSGTPVYLAFFFQSDSSTPAGLGAFLDNVEITAYPPYKTYLAMIRRDPTPEVTPTPTSLPYNLVKSYTFEPGDGGTQDWCQANTGDWAGGIRSMGGSNAYYLGVKQSSWTVMQSPRFTLDTLGVTNYRIAAQFNLLNLNNSLNLADYAQNDMGIVFSVWGSQAFPPDYKCEWAQSAPDGGYYKFIFRIKAGGVGYRTQFVRIEKEVTPDVGPALDLPESASFSRTSWNTLWIDRVGKTVTAYINGVKVNEWTNDIDEPRLYAGWFGIYTDAQGNNPGGLLESDWDNLQVYKLP